MEPTENRPTSATIGEHREHILSPPFGGKDDAEREYSQVRQYYQEDESAADASVVLEFPSSVQQY